MEVHQNKHNIKENSDVCNHYDKASYADCVDQAYWEYFEPLMGCVPPLLSVK